jgi:uncharacterized SAM-binding protein YcdF (DUF218 family)
VIVGNQLKEGAVQIDRQAEQVKDSSVRLGVLPVQRYRWTLSLRAKVLLLSLLIAISVIMFFRIYPLLAVTHRVDADILIVEGWGSFYAIQFAAKDFNSHRYNRVFTTGGPVTGKGGYVNDFQTLARVEVEFLEKAGLPAGRAQMVPSRAIGRDRTYSAAIALRAWLRAHYMQLHAINIVTEDVHARRKCLLFQKARGPETRVGIIAVPNPDYDARRWWLYSHGVEAIIDESVGYLHATLLFPLTGREQDRADPRDALRQRQAISAGLPAA